MDIIKRQLKVRNNRMVHISRYFRFYNITKFARQNFVQTISQGMQLNNDLKNVAKFGKEVIARIENYLIACEETILAAGIEVSTEYCEVVEILEDFRDERLLIMRFLNGGLDNRSFI